MVKRNVCNNEGISLYDWSHIPQNICYLKMSDIKAYCIKDMKGSGILMWPSTKCFYDDINMPMTVFPFLFFRKKV